MNVVQNECSLYTFFTWFNEILKFFSFLQIYLLDSMNTMTASAAEKKNIFPKRYYIFFAFLSFQILNKLLPKNRWKKRMDAQCRIRTTNEKWNSEGRNVYVFSALLFYVMLFSFVKLGSIVFNWIICNPGYYLIEKKMIIIIKDDNNNNNIIIVWWQCQRW